MNVHAILGSMSNPYYPLSEGQCYLFVFGLPVLCFFLGWGAVLQRRIKVQFSLSQMVFYVMAIGFCVALLLAATVKVEKVAEEVSLRALPMRPWMAICLASQWLLAGHLTATAILHHRKNSKEVEESNRIGIPFTVFSIAICLVGSAISFSFLIIRVLFAVM